MRSIFCVLSKDIIRRNVYDTEFWPDFCKKTRGIKKVLLVPPDDLERYQDLFKGENIVLEGYEKVSWLGWSKLVMFLVRNGIYSHSTKTYRWRAYAEGAASFVVTVSKELLSTTLGRLSLYQNFVRKLTEHLPTSAALERIFDTYKPGVVFVPSLIDLDFDVPIAIAARKRHIPVIGMVRSWDNLNNHGLMPFYPDHFVVQNQWLKEAAGHYQGIATSNLPKDVVGLPHYDAYKRSADVIKTREDFFRDFGLDTSKKLIFVGGSDFYYSEDVLPQLLNDAIESGEVTVPAQAVFRPHPRSLFRIEDYKLEALPHIKLNNAFGGKPIFADAEDFINLLAHADLIINIASTLSIDAAIFDKPALCIGFDDPAKELTTHQAVMRLYDSFDHYEALVETGGVKVASSARECITVINNYLQDSALDREGRRRIVERFAAPYDGKSGTRLATVVSNYATHYLKMKELNGIE